MSFEFKVFTLNCWGIAYVSKDRTPRIKAIAELLATSNYDVVCLQEVWTDRDYLLIRDKVAGALPHSHYFYSGVAGSGVCIFSKHPIRETFFHQWSLNGYIHKLHHGDWFGGKGVGLCKLTVDNYNINVYSAHLHAEYNRTNDEYEAHRILQAYDTAQFIKLTSESADLVILAGDLNTEPEDLAYRVILTVPGLVDSYKEAAEVSKGGQATCESIRNSYTPSSLIKQYMKENIPGKRIDYIMYHPGSKLQVQLKNYDHPLPERVPNHGFSYSDHEAVEATLMITKRKVESLLEDEQVKMVLEKCLGVLNKSLSRLVSHKIIYLLSGILLLALLLGTLYLELPYGYQLALNVVRVLTTVLIVFCFVMGTIWNKIERHGVIAGKLAIELNLNSYKNL